MKVNVGMVEDSKGWLVVVRIIKEVNLLLLMVNGNGKELE